MKKILFTIIAVSMVLSSLAAMANDDKNFTITPKFTLNYLLDGDLKDGVGSIAYGLAVEGYTTSIPVGLEVGYLYASKSHNGIKSTLTQIPILAKYKAPFTPDSNFYYDLGAGISINKGKAGNVSNSKTAFAFKVMGGWNITDNWIAELGYANYGNVEDVSSNAIQLNVGYNF